MDISTDELIADVLAVLFSDNETELHVNSPTVDDAIVSSVFTPRLPVFFAVLQAQYQSATSVTAPAVAA